MSKTCFLFQSEKLAQSLVKVMNCAPGNSIEAEFLLVSA